MTIISNVASCTSSIKGASASFSRLAQYARNDQEQELFHECMLEMDTIFSELQLRIEEMRAQEVQYKS